MPATRNDYSDMRLVAEGGRVLKHAHGDVEVGEGVYDGDNFTIPVTLYYDKTRLTEDAAKAWLAKYLNAANPVRRWAKTKGATDGEDPDKT